jgi:hypothetical protein
MKRLNNYAADMIPIRLIISVAVVSAITFLVLFGFFNLRIILSENQIENDCRALESKLYTMLRSGVPRNIDETGAGDGTKRIHVFNVPSNIVFLSFGVDPDKNNDGILKTGLTENGAVIYYRVQGGSKQVIWLDKDFRFREGKFEDNKWVINGSGEGFIIRDYGRYILNFELVQKNRKTYILIHSNDGIES